MDCRWPRRTDGVGNMPSSYQEKQLLAMRDLEAASADGGTRSTIVPMLRDAAAYASDDRLCLTAVCFLDETLASSISSEFLAQLKETDPHHYFYLPRSMHVTIQNLRTICAPPSFDAEHIRTAEDVLARVIAAHKAFELKLEGILKLPTSVSIAGLSDEGLPELVLDLRQALADAGIADDKKYNGDVVFANVTVCRYTHSPSEPLLNLLESQGDRFFGSLPVRAIDLITTNAACHPDKTTVIRRFALSS